MRSDQVAQGIIPLDLENLPGWRLHSLSGQPVPMPDHPSWWRRFSLYLVRTSLLSIFVCCLILLPWSVLFHLPCTAVKNLAPSSQLPPCIYWQAAQRSHMHSFLQAEQVQFPQPLLIGHVVQTLWPPWRPYAKLALCFIKVFLVVVEKNRCSILGAIYC